MMYIIMYIMNTTISISAARKKIFDIGEEVQASHNRYTLTENGSPKVVIISADEYDSLIETLEVARLFPNLEKDIKIADKAIRTKQLKDFVSLTDLKKTYARDTLKQKSKKVSR